MIHQADEAKSNRKDAKVAKTSQNGTRMDTDLHGFFLKGGCWILVGDSTSCGLDWFRECLGLDFGTDFHRIGT